MRLTRPAAGSDIQRLQEERHLDFESHNNDEHPAATATDGIVFEDQGPGPRTHVLVVGVGHYPNFRGGGDHADDLSRLGQLRSSTASARLIARWFLDEYRYPPAPLGSLALLCSEAEGATFESQDGPQVPLSSDYLRFAEAARA